MQTLRDYQQGSGIPFEDQIVLINNPRVFNGFTPYNHPWNATRPIEIGKTMARRATSLLSANRSAKLPKDQVFVGYFDRSHNTLGMLFALFAEIANHPKRRFQIVVSKGDYAVDDTLLEKIPANVDKLCLNNLNTRDSRLFYLPMGRDFRSIDVFKDRLPSSDKEMLCYCNYSVNTHPFRQQVADLVADKAFVTQRHMGKFLDYSLSREQFFDHLQSAKFCLCPRGKAIDTFRMWDALYCGTIPIVVQEAVFHDQLEDLPILFLNSYEEFGSLTAEKLEAVYEEMMDREYNFDKLRASHWLNSVRQN